MLSLAKLSALASGDDEVEPSEMSGAAVSALVERVEHGLSTVAAQEQLPTAAIEAVGEKRDTMRVLTPREIIEVSFSDKAKRLCVLCTYKRRAFLRTFVYQY